MKNWMITLSEHYKMMRKKYPDSKLMIVFDIDDTIVNIKIPLHYILQKYDNDNETTYFKGMGLEDVTFEEWHIEDWLPEKVDESDERVKVVEYVRENLWKENTIMMSHKPFKGVLEIIRYFQIQDKVEVGLNTGRSEELREVTLKSLNLLGQEFRVSFPSEKLFMNPLPNEKEKDVTSYKSKGIQKFQEEGYKVIAFIDNEPANLKAVEEMNDEEILLLHADTMFGSSKKLMPKRSISGEFYDFTNVVEMEPVSKHISFVWNGVNLQSIFDDYKKSNVHWAEIDIRRHPISEKIVLKHSRFDAPKYQDRDYITLEEMLHQLVPMKRGIKIVLKEDKGLLDEVIEILKKFELSAESVWFDFVFEVFDDFVIKRINKNFPNCMISTRVDFLVPLIHNFDHWVFEILENMFTMGIKQFSISYDTYNKELFLSKMDEWDFDVNIRDVFTFKGLLRAILSQPKSIISTFNFD